VACETEGNSDRGRNNKRRNCLRRREEGKIGSISPLCEAKVKRERVTLFVKLNFFLPARRKFHFAEKQSFRAGRKSSNFNSRRIISRLSFTGLSYRAAVLEIIELDATTTSATTAVAFNPTWNFHVSCVLVLRVIFNLLVIFPSLAPEKGQKARGAPRNPFLNLNWDIIVPLRGRISWLRIHPYPLSVSLFTSDSFLRLVSFFRTVREQI